MAGPDPAEDWGAARPRHRSRPEDKVVSAQSAVMMHLLHKAREERARAIGEVARLEAAVGAAGFRLGAVDRALWLATADPEIMARDDREAAELLLSARAPVVIEEAHVAARVTEESSGERRERLRNLGYFAAVLGQRNDGGGLPDGSGDQAAWRTGFDDFRADLSAYLRAGRANGQDQRMGRAAA